jgi:hypothetical protein
MGWLVKIGFPCHTLAIHPGLGPTSTASRQAVCLVTRPYVTPQELINWQLIPQFISQPYSTPNKTSGTSIPQKQKQRILSNESNKVL